MRNRKAEFWPAFIVPRYGHEVIGGAEDLVRKTAEELARRNYRVTVLTTCAIDHLTWKNEYPPGKYYINGVEVLRFPAITRLHEPSCAKAVERIASGEKVGKTEQRIWLDGVVVSPELFGHLATKSSNYTHLIFLPYLFGTTYFGSQISPERSFIIPCLHDEPFAHQALVSEMLMSVRGLIFNSEGEKKLASRILGEKELGAVVGMGFEEQKGDASAFFNRTSVRGRFLLYAGRREEGKNTPLLIDYFRKFSIQYPGELSLVLTGAGKVRIPPDSSNFIFDLGKVSESEKWDTYAACFAFCQPSVNESLSIVLLESWLAGKPALVNRNCEVTSEHVRSSGGGLVFGDYPEFAESLLFLLENPEIASKIGLKGKNYVLENYNWDKVIDKLLKALGVSEN
ncbi:MAG: glycosyltransferase family 4 protein [Actinomycetota bacterium]|nr:glycosyltransferase family 4 protein [Actinomycetota bacterium]